MINIKDYSKIQNLECKIFLSLGIALLVVYSGIWTPFNENYSYWYFSKIVEEDSQLTTTGRSTLYVLYLTGLKLFFTIPVVFYVEQFIFVFFLALTIELLLERMKVIYYLRTIFNVWIIFYSVQQIPIVQSYSLLLILLAILLYEKHLLSE